MNKIDATNLLHQYIENKNLRKHCYSVAAVMKSLAKYFNEDENTWEIAGILHDVDYEQFPKTHPTEGLKILKDQNYPAEIIEAVAAHAWGYGDNYPEPKNRMEWGLYCCDELTGFIVAVTLVRPERKISLVTVDNILSKWNSKSFAAGVSRKQIEMCEEKLGIKLPDFVEIALKAMQEIQSELGL